MSRSKVSFQHYRDCQVLANLWYWTYTLRFFWYLQLKSSTIEYGHLYYSLSGELNYTRTLISALLSSDCRIRIEIKKLMSHPTCLWEYSRVGCPAHMQTSPFIECRDSDPWSHTRSDWGRFMKASCTPLIFLMTIPRYWAWESALSHRRRWARWAQGCRAGIHNRWYWVRAGVLFKGWLLLVFPN